MKKYRILLAALMALPMLWACTDVDLCNEGEHPHRGSVFFEYQNAKMLPDSMVVLANRILNLWKGTMKVKTSTGKGYYVANAPMEWNDVTNAYEPVTSSVVNFRLPVGDYKFVTFNMADEELDYTELNQYITDPEMPLADINLNYRTYAQKDVALGKLLNDWTDYNRYADFVQPIARPLYYDTVVVKNINSGSSYLLNFNPHEMTQEIEFNFTVNKDISKQAFRVDSVFADIAGIPHAINLSKGEVDISKTNKLLFRMNKISDADTKKSVACKGTIHVLGIVQPTHSKMTLGPGILQLYICCSAPTSAGTRESKRIPVLINLYNTLKKTPSIRLATDYKSASKTTQKLKLVIQAKDLVINGQHVVTDSDSDGGLDQWQQPDADDFVVIGT